MIKDSTMAVNYHNFLWFTVAVLLTSIHYTWLYNFTNGSLIIASLYHGSTNAINIILFSKEDVSSSVFPFFMVITIFALTLVFMFKPDSLCHGKRVMFGVHKKG